MGNDIANNAVHYEETVVHRQNYHFIEVYDPNKNYTGDIFEANYNNRGIHRYKYVHLITGGRQYMIAKEILTHEEKQHLSKHCQCDYHIKLMIRLTMTPKESGCISSNNPAQCVIDKTRAYISKKNE